MDILLPSVDLLRLSQITEENSSPLVNKDRLKLIKPLSYSGHIHQLLLIISASIDYTGWPTINICDFFVSLNNNIITPKLRKLILLSKDSNDADTKCTSSTKVEKS